MQKKIPLHQFHNMSTNIFSQSSFFMTYISLNIQIYLCLHANMKLPAVLISRMVFLVMEVQVHTFLNSALG